ncbi:MAG: hypothetical protein A3F43_04725 [Gammaproteobacteria bacterium RIFCSPHIGHO2_12_FULL_42_10]|nr:MAG: hypothetical protein A3F43_04725 [Gammaproteobacteria bacterium RIFCSPHIGHO2_12_FULL_42_10]
MLSRLDWMTLTPRVILDIGCGEGKSTQQLRLRYPKATVLALDLSWPMIEHAKQTTHQILCLQADGKTLPLRNQSVDLIFANFVLPWQPDITRVLTEWQRVLSSDGLLMFTMLGLDTLQAYQTFFPKETHPTLYDMHDVGDCLSQINFSDPVLDVARYEMAYHDPERLVSDLLASELWMPQDSTTEKEATKMIYNLTPTEDGWPLTYEVIYAHAFKAPPKTPGMARIPLTNLQKSLPSKT